MADILTKLRPDRDLQCYFERPSAIAALSEASATGFTVSGCWRQQFDWAVVEWNRDNVFEHPMFRNLPDSDLSGLVLSYRETRENCIPLDSDLFATVDWPALRIWAERDGTEQIFKVPLKRYASPVSGSYAGAVAELELAGEARGGDYVGIALEGQHYTVPVYGADTVGDIAARIAESVNAFCTFLDAESAGAKLTLRYATESGANGNRVAVYGHVTPGSPLGWVAPFQQFSGGQSPTEWLITLPFAELRDEDNVLVPTSRVRKMRWTYAAELQAGAFQRSEFAVRVRDWTVNGERTTYRVAGPGSRRIEDEEAEYSGVWEVGRGNFSGASIRYSTQRDAKATFRYRTPVAHTLFLGSRLCFNAGAATVKVDGVPRDIALRAAGEDVLIRVPLGEYEGGEHEVTVVHSGVDGEYLYVDFVELAVPSESLPQVEADRVITLATDWDTDHSIALAPERTAWQMISLGFLGRANHYTGALWFYELKRDRHVYASAQVVFEGIPAPSSVTELAIGTDGQPPEKITRIQHLNLAGDTPETIAHAFANEVNRGFTALRAEAEGNVLRLFARAMGPAGNALTVRVSPEGGAFRAICSGDHLAGGVDGEWHTDLDAMPRINRAARDWSRSFYRALAAAGIDVAAAFSMELQHGDPSPDAGIAQRYPNGAAALLNTPALQTNFSPVSLAFWRDVYRGMAEVQMQAGVRPYLQFGEVQWWYFANAAGMPFYDAYTTERFLRERGRELPLIRTHTEDPAAYTEALRFLADLIGEFTAAVRAHVLAAFPDCRFEVLYPPDVNDTALNTLVNYPEADWTRGNLECLKTESFTYTYQRDLDASRRSMRTAAQRGFNAANRSHLIGISDPVASWMTEAQMAISEGTESVVLFALDQFCLIGYPVPIPRRPARSVTME